MSQRQCVYCDTQADLRPYGPGGAWVCFSCAMSTPERKQVTERQFQIQLDECGDVVLIGTENGPIPFTLNQPKFKQ